MADVEEECTVLEELVVFVEEPGLNGDTPGLSKGSSK